MGFFNDNVFAWVMLCDLFRCVNSGGVVSSDMLRVATQFLKDLFC